MLACFVFFPPHFNLRLSPLDLMRAGFSEGPGLLRLTWEWVVPSGAEKGGPSL